MRTVRMWWAVACLSVWLPVQASVLETVLPADLEALQTLVPALQELPEQDRRRVLAYVMRMEVAKLMGTRGIPPGTTVGEAIVLQKEWEEAQLPRKAASEPAPVPTRVVSADELRAMVEVTLVEKYVLPENFAERRLYDQQAVVLKLLNRTPGLVQGVSGTLTFIDIFDEEVGLPIRFSITQDLLPNEEDFYFGGWDINSDRHRRIQALPPGRFQTRFNIEVVVLEDGTRVRAKK